MSAKIDTKDMIAKVAQRHGILLRRDDPAFAIVTMNELVLEAMAAQLIQQVNSSINEFKAAADRIQMRAGATFAEEVRTAIDSVRAGLRADIEAGGFKARELVMEVHLTHSRRNFVRWFSAGLLAALVLLACGAFFGKMIYG
jgi:hypothetical protein